MQFWRSTTCRLPRAFVAGLLLALFGLTSLGNMTPQACAQPADTAESKLATEQSPADNDKSTDDKPVPADANSDDSPTGAATRREMLRLLGVDDQLFAGFTDGQPLADSQRDDIVKLLAALDRIAPDILAKDAHPTLALDRLYEAPAGARGEVFQLRFDTVRVTQLELAPELAQRFNIKALYHCQGRIGLNPIEIYALHIPPSWKLDRAMEQPCTASAVFLQALPTPEQPEPSDLPPTAVAERTPLLFAADRIAWHPPTLLAYLGVDYGLLEQVKDRTPLTEREVFYQMLAAANRMSDEYLQYQIRRLLKTELEHERRLARNRDLPAETRQAAQRAVESLQAGVSDVVPLFNDPQKSRGRFVVLEGEALRAIEIRVDDPEIERRFHLDHYFEVEIVTPDSQNNPIVCCLTQLPPGMPLGESIHESVRVAGFFLKSWAFESRSSKARSAAENKQALQVAPLLVGKTLEVIAPLQFTPPTQSLQLLVGLAVVLAVAGLAIWRARVNDRRACARLQANRDQLPAEISFEPTPADGGQEPPPPSSP